jgi:hypothetical protein
MLALPVLLCLTYRPDFVHRWAEAGWFEEMRVQPLADNDMQQLARALLGRDPSLMAMIAAAKSRDLAVVLVGHVTKDGSVAGPRTLEHLVDVVLTFEGDRQGPLRLVRAVKNRYGAADEIGCFELVDDDRPDSHVDGVPVVDPPPATEGSETT